MPAVLQEGRADWDLHTADTRAEFT
jgi:hypothetical protein